ncbi:MAG TPA: tryptophan synthase subunit alpha [Dehalococcoidia bacterium]|nr:tryptophan synthase subunit alpha [Dehalococcoidia bacterium]
MSRIASVFNKVGRKALIAYITIGYPSIEATMDTVPVLAKSGCDIIELGIPFSDPLADGTTIQKASHHALQNGVTTKICLEVASKLSRMVDTPLVFMGYYNPVLWYGIEPFCRDCAIAGVDGLIIPDLPPEEGSELEIATKGRGLDLIYLLAPTSTDGRIKLVTDRSRGFIYLVSVTGVTGARESLPADLEVFIARVKALARQPLCVGFGISTPQQAKQVACLADGVIVGSRVIKLMEENNSLASVGSFIKGLRQAIDKPTASG